MTDCLITGIGGAGNNIAEHIHQAYRLPVLLINTDSQAFGGRLIPKRLLIGEVSCGGSPAHSPERGQQAAQESLSEIDNEIAAYSTIVVVAGLGGGTGTGASAEIIDLALTRGKCVIAAVTLPYEFETKRRAVALEALEKLRLKPIHLIVHDNTNALHDSEKNQGMMEVMEAVSRNLSADIYNALQVSR